MTDSSVNPSSGAKAGLADDQVPLPDFILSREGGLFVDLSLLDSGERFHQFAARVFDADQYFEGLDYGIFQLLLTEPDSPLLLQQSRGNKERPLVRLAAGLQLFPPERQSLYRGVKMSADGTRAEYIFEPVSLEVSEVVIVQDPPDENGEQPPPRQETRRFLRRAWLQADEFIAAMWRKGLRFGLDMARVTAACASDKAERQDIARWQPATEGRDASIVEQSDILYRDDSPRRLADGRVDLTAFHNRFPQVTAETRLLRKTPRLLGRDGWNVRGDRLQAALPQDCELEPLAGPGTRVDRTGEGEFIVATMNGFLSIDTATNQISVSDKIIDRHGVSLRTTGDLRLSGAEFEEHGEVQERRQVKGHDMSFLADVFGHISSDGGRVLLKSSLAGGSVTNPGGEVTVEGRASRSVIIARHGSVQLQYAESCLIIADRVTLVHGVGCDILGGEVSVERAEGCAIAGRVMTLGTTGDRHGVDTLVTLFLPDGAQWDKERSDLDEERQLIADKRQAAESALAQLQQEPELVRFLKLRQSIQEGAVAMDASQKTAWQGMLNRVAPLLAQIKTQRDALQALDVRSGEIDARYRELDAIQRSAEATVRCRIGAIVGETRVRGRPMTDPGLPFASLGEKALRARLREAAAADRVLFVDRCGSFCWPPESATDIGS